jgi:hypothetical protein
MKVQGSVPIFPTEDADKVVLCIQNLFPDSVIERHSDRVTFLSRDLKQLAIVLEDQRIRDTALMVVRRSMEDDAASFFLNKQAAFMGKANFTEGRSSLGDIRIDILEGALEFMESITPRTI